MRTDTHQGQPARRASEHQSDDIFVRIRQGKNVKVPLLAEAIGMSRGGLYQAIERGDVEHVTIGRAIFIPARVAARLLGIENREAA